jgi:Cu/Ag efflux protein CusF
VKKLILILATVCLMGCSSAKQSGAVPAGASGASGQASALKRYPMHGKVLSVNASEKSARIEGDPIGDWMGAMTMNYPVKDDAGLATLAPGTTIDATVFVDGDNFWVGDIKTAK